MTTDRMPTSHANTKAARKQAKIDKALRKMRAREEKRLNKRAVTFTPPEGVPVHFEAAGLAIRLGAQLLDLLITGLAVAAVLLLLTVTFRIEGPVVNSLGALLFFAIRTPYYVLAELLWNGVTLGKRATGLRVISADGRSLSPHAVVVRNLMKEAEIFVPGAMLLIVAALDWPEQALTIIWVFIVLAIPLFNRHRQRLGDIIAGTYVVHHPKAVLLEDVAKASPPVESGFTFQPHQLDHYGAFELQTLEQLLRGPNASVGNSAAARRRDTLRAVVERIRTKIDYPDVVRDTDLEPFLNAFYAAQRAHLEQRQLFGEKRADKFHRESE
ncbi:MAG: RDD family protein [Pikeienuella sp.]